MKVIQFYKSEKQLIQKAVKQHRGAQRHLYEKFSPKMLAVCRMYIKDVHHAEEVMLSGFLKVFTHIRTFTFKGSFEGWIRKIMVREAINFLRKQKPLFLTDDITPYADHTWNTINTEIEVEQIQDIIDALPNGCLLYTSPSPRDRQKSRMPSSA